MTASATVLGILLSIDNSLAQIADIVHQIGYVVRYKELDSVDLLNAGCTVGLFVTLLIVNCIIAWIMIYKRDILLKWIPRHNNRQFQQINLSIFRGCFWLLMADLFILYLPVITTYLEQHFSERQMYMITPCSIMIFHWITLVGFMNIIDSVNIVIGDNRIRSDMIVYGSFILFFPFPKIGFSIFGFLLFIVLNMKSHAVLANKIICPNIFIISIYLIVMHTNRTSSHVLLIAYIFIVFVQNNVIFACCSITQSTEKNFSNKNKNVAEKKEQ